MTEEAFIDVSNVEVVCDKCGKATRVAHSFADGKKVRVCKKCGATLDKAYTKKSKQKPVEEAEAPKKRTRKRSQKAADAAETATQPENENKE